MDMITKEFIVSKIDASVDGGPYVFFTLSDPRDFREGVQQAPGPTVMGVSSMDDLETLKNSGDGLLEGVISGRAIYDGLIDPGEAAALLGGWN